MPARGGLGNWARAAWSRAAACDGVREPAAGRSHHKVAEAAPHFHAAAWHVGGRGHQVLGVGAGEAGDHAVVHAPHRVRHADLHRRRRPAARPRLAARAAHVAAVIGADFQAVDRQAWLRALVVRSSGARAGAAADTRGHGSLLPPQRRRLGLQLLRRHVFVRGCRRQRVVAGGGGRRWRRRVVRRPVVEQHLFDVIALLRTKGGVASGARLVSAGLARRVAHLAKPQRIHGAVDRNTRPAARLPSSKLVIATSLLPSWLRGLARHNVVGGGEGADWLRGEEGGLDAHLCCGQSCSRLAFRSRHSRTFLFTFPVPCSAPAPALSRAAMQVAHPRPRALQQHHQPQRALGGQQQGLAAAGRRAAGAASLRRCHAEAEERTATQTQAGEPGDEGRACRHGHMRAWAPACARAVSDANSDGRHRAGTAEPAPPPAVDVDIDKEVSKFARSAATTFAPRASGATGKNPAYRGSALYTVFEVQAWLALLVGGLLSFNIIFPSDQPDIARLLGMWSIWWVAGRVGLVRPVSG